ncbi:cytochrome P450 315a1, mitochondrial [Tribolium madens]|uniref:cytochrome P450 315a1, mitochondrial n=1 Tax=Tribolium madens TaxID=41895 RepID=UPI001CF730D2|nr:cytochrome P450 315a1, mitochondrial [Tribolium madens]
MLFRRVLAQLTRPKSSLVSANTVLHFEDIPSPKGLPLVGTTFSLIAHGSTPKLHDYVDHRHKQLGPIFKEKLGPVSAVFVSDPDEIRAVFGHEGKYPMHVLPDAWVAYNQMYGCPRGLFFMDGPNWWHHRRIMNRMLLKGDFKWIEEACECVSDKLIKSLMGESDYCGNLEATLYKWSLDVIVSILLGSDSYNQLCEELEPKVEKLAQVTHLVFQTSAKLALIPASFASKFKIPQWRRFVESVDNALTQANSLVDTLIEKKPQSSGLLPKLLNEKITLDDIKRIIVDLVLAAGDTTAVGMEWMLYLVAKNPQIQEKLRQKPDYVKHVFKETLRLYPVAPFLTRILPEDAILGGYGVPKGTLVVMSIYTSGRDERYFKNPSHFQPERWDRKDEFYNSDMQKASLPFAMGLRACVGRKVAETQLQMTLLKIVNKFEVELGNKREIEIVLKMVAVPLLELKK